TIMFASSKRCNEVSKKLQQGEEITQYYTICINGGEAQKYFSVDLLASDIKPLSQDDLYVVNAKFDYNRPDLTGLSEPEKLQALKDYKERGYTLFEEAPFWFNGVGMTNRKRNRLYIFNSKTKEATPITEPLFNVINAKCNDQYVLYQGSTFDTLAPTKNGLYLYNINTQQTRTLIEPNEIRIKFMELYGSDKVVISYSERACTQDFKLNENGDIYILDIASCERKFLVAHDHQNFGHNSTGTDARFGGGFSAKIVKDDLYYVTTKLNHSYLNVLDLKTGAIKELTSDGSVDSFDMNTHNNNIFMVVFKQDEIGELYKLADNKEVKLTSFNDFVYDNYSISTPELVTCKKKDLLNNSADLEVYGYVMKPVNYVEGNSYPAILHIHGGPRTVLSSIFHNEMQLWANAGYFVLYSNPRGSDGRGNDFAEITARYGKEDYEDLMDFTDTVLDLYSDIDKDRVGVTGGSYGGFMTNWIIGQTDRFKCACSQRSISNWTTFEGTTDIGHYFTKDQTGASHMDNYELQWEQSPLKYANQVKTPTLFIHAEEDYRCWYVEALQLFSALKMYGVPTKLYLFKGENHELSRSGRPKNRIKRMEAILGWMDEYLK
ncbi:MAG: S9 family peptidase, partial [bacterium]